VSISAPVGTSDDTTGEALDSDGGQCPTAIEAPEKITAKKTRKRAEEDLGKVVDVVLSDMSEPWPLESPNYWKRSLSDPYIRMMNTSGIGYKDHAGSMVCDIRPVQTYLILTLNAGSMLRSTSICGGHLEDRWTFYLQVLSRI
jgi:hypothetical protein